MLHIDTSAKEEFVLKVEICTIKASDPEMV